MENGCYTWILVASSLMAMALCHVAKAEQPPAVFVFGDSTVDVGTNNLLNGSKVRADFPHYGVDFPESKPTGRFSNGLNVVDFIALLMGHERSPPPFLSFVENHHFEKNEFKGLNFASAGSGLSDDTGSTLGVVTLRQQIRQFEAIKDSLTALEGIETIESFLRKSVFIISTGSNDIFGYIATNSTVYREGFTSLLVDGYEYYIRTLYSFGARKFGITNIAPLGCCPIQRLLNQTGGCFDPANEVAQIFNPKLRNMLSNLSSELPAMKYSLGNVYQLTIDTIQNPLPLNLTNVDGACCGYGKQNAEKLCDPTANLCANRENFLFWDSFHPTQAAARAAAEIIYNGPIEYASPINFAQLAIDDI